MANIERIVPWLLEIDASSICQLQCPRCPVREMAYDDAIPKCCLTFEHFKSIVDRNPKIRLVSLFSFGELLLNKDLLKILAYAYEHRIVVFGGSSTLNGASDEVLEGFVKYQLHSLSCAIDGTTQETYAVYRKGGNFERVMDSVRRINAVKKKHRSHYPLLEWAFIVFGHNERQLPAARRMAGELGMAFRPNMNWDSTFSPIIDHAFVKRETGWAATTREEYQRLRGQSFVGYPCTSLWSGPRINADGSVAGCCWNVWQPFGGNAFSDGYLEAANGPRIAAARSLLTGASPRDEGLPCARCEYYQTMASAGRWLTRRQVRPSPGATIKRRLATMIWRSQLSLDAGRDGNLLWSVLYRCSGIFVLLERMMKRMGERR